MSQVTGVKSAVVTRVLPTQLEVLVACDRPDNPYKKGLRADLNTGLCCETVMQERSRLHVVNALKDPAWSDNPNVSLGLISYLGLPLEWESGEIFGTLCILDSNEISDSPTCVNLLQSFKDSIEADLRMVTRVAERQRGAAELEQLRSDRRHLLTLIDSTSDLVALLNLYGEVFHINAAGLSMIGCGASESRRLTVADIEPERDARRFFGEILPAVKEQGLWSGEQSLLRLDGSVIPVSQVFVLLRNSVGDAVGVGMVARDISQRIRAERDLRLAKDIAVSGNDQMKRDLQAAARVQKSLLPRVLPTSDQVRFAWTHQPCEELAGDALNVFPLDGNNFGLYVLDVSGHGVKAALMCVAVSHALIPRADAPCLVKRPQPDLTRSTCVSPADVARQLNSDFRLHDDTEQFFTMLYGVLNVQTRRFRFVCAGHPSPIHARPGKFTKLIESAGYPIALMDEVDYDDSEVALEPGDRLYLFSDGVMEQMKEGGELFGVSRVQTAINQSHHLSLHDSVQFLRQQVDAWRGPRSPSDDVSILALEC